MNEYNANIENNNLENNQSLNEITNSNMNINTELNISNNLFNPNNDVDDLDIFPNYPRPSLGNGDLPNNF